MAIFDVREDGFLTVDGRRMRCHVTSSFLRVEDLKSPLPTGFNEKSQSARDSFLRDNMYRDSNGKWYCKEQGALLTRCAGCGGLHHPTKMVQTSDGLVCRYCRENHYRECAHCHKVVRRNRGNTWIVNVDETHRERQFLCDTCTNHGDTSPRTSGLYYQCQHCGDLVLRENIVNIGGGEGRSAMHLCPRCNYDMNRRNLHGYHYRRDPGYGMSFLGVENRQRDVLMGVELEIDEGGESEANAGYIREAIGKDYVVCSTDGSLRNGFEIVSCPASYSHHLKTIKWEDGMKKAKELGYVSHDGGRCGLHVHVDRKFFGTQMQDDVEAKFFIIFRNNLSWIKAFSRRYNYGYCAINGYEHSEDGSGDTLGAITYPPDKIWLKSKKQQGGRHMALNFQGGDTIEIRIFRGTLSYKTFKATLQFVDMWCNFVKKTELNNITRVSLSHFISAASAKGYREFLKYLEERKIVESSEPTGE